MQLVHVLLIAYCAAARVPSEFNVFTAQSLMRARVRRSADLSKSVPEDEKRYAVVVDAGSSGSRVFMYWWRQLPTAPWQLPTNTRLEFVTNSDGHLATFSTDRHYGGISEAYERAIRVGSRTVFHPTKAALEGYLEPLLTILRCSSRSRSAPQRPYLSGLQCVFLI